ncbi:ankyrin repeat protein [Maribacter vaceletii]|uniref:Ankyrin repeat protein n=1 Tax=Maribacter vaceletii TaxID=1206816 RepID=A0A495E8K2_9FLAO|nr:ankyrin repeat domain-containing protein [Maribacter vaceletii]RKR12127.1 ankyrin repeat protein [Maribacter vaceletii]
MKTNFKTFLLALVIGLLSFNVSAQRTKPKSSNIFLNADYWKKQPSITKIKASQKEGHSLTEANAGGFDATTFAIFGGNSVKTIDYLLSQGNDVNKRTHDSRTYIFWTASRGYLDVVKFLVNKGSKLDLVDSHGYGIISFTAAAGQTNTEVYDYLIASGGDVKKEKDHHGNNSLLVAASRAKDLKLVDYFISKGLDINSTDDHGNGIFNYAAQGGNIDILKQLVDRGVSIKKNKITKENAIFFASKGKASTLALFEYLEGLGLSANITTTEGVTPLHNLAGSTKDQEILDYFVAKGVNPNATNKEGETALLKAAARNKLPIVTYFTEKTQNINLADKNGKTALTAAIQSNSAGVVSYLIAKGANIEALDAKGNNVAAYLFNGRGKPRDFDAKVAALTKKGFDFKKLQGDDRSIWHLAVSKNNIGLLKKISAFGADINAKDKNGNSPLHYAAMKTENTDILKFLIANGADIKSTTEFGETALDLANENELLVKNKVNLQFLNY